MNDLVSIVIPTYDRPEMLREAVASGLAQTWRKVEVVVVDDASPLPVSPFDDDRVRVVVHEQNRGAAAAINTGVAAAEGAWVTVLSDDDWMFPTRISDVLPSAHDMVLSWAVYDGASGKDATGRRLEGDARDVIWDSFTPSMSGLLIRRSAWMSIDESYRTCEDVEWWMRMTSAHRVTTVPVVGVRIRRHDGPRHMSGDDARLRDSLRILSEHSSYFESHRRARAFRWRRVATYAGRGGDRRLAAQAMVRSLTSRPSFGAVRHAVPTVLGRR